MPREKAHSIAEPGQTGAKLALFLGNRLLVIQRDDIPTIPYPGLWDLPGGGREAGESPQDCVLRETREEVGLMLAPSDLSWKRQYGPNWFFAAHLPAALMSQIVFGDEGQCWRMMRAQDFVDSNAAVAILQDRVRDYLKERPPAISGGGK